MIYAKLQDNNLIYAPNTLVIGDKRIANPTTEQYKVCGWLPVFNTDPPETIDEGFTAKPHWEQLENEIREVWEIIPIPEPIPQPLSIEQRVSNVEQELVYMKESYIEGVNNA